MTELNQQQDCDAFIREALSSAQYRDPQRTRQDMLEVLAQYPGLKPVTEPYVFNNGSEELLLAMSGTIPIHHKGHLYYIPIWVWLLSTYPYNAPIVFVKPTPDMRIKISSQVAYDGKVNLPYLQEWKHNSSELILLIQVLIITFQEEPPVYSVFASPPPYPVSPSSGLYNPYQQVHPHQNSLSPQRTLLLRKVEEKLVVRLLKVYQTAEAERQASEQLQLGSKRLSMMLKRMEQEEEILQQDVQKVQKEINSVAETLVSHEAEVETRKAAVIDDAIQVPRPLYNQIVTNYAEDQALEDAIYFVSEGLRSGRMDLDQFEKSIRKLARKQFMLRLLIIKCRQKAGLK